jgi:hypothetical protein
VEPNRSRLEAGQQLRVAREVEAVLPLHVSGVFEDLVRESVPRHPWLGRSWGPAASWWGPGLDREPLEVDVVAASEDGRELLVGEVKWQDPLDWRRAAAALRAKAERLPFAGGRRLHLAIWSKRRPAIRDGGIACFTPRQVIAALR